MLRRIKLKLLPSNRHNKYKRNIAETEEMYLESFVFAWVINKIVCLGRTYLKHFDQYLHSTLTVIKNVCD